jgi:hypothetical protein
MTNDALLGPADCRKKVDMRLPVVLTEQVAGMADLLGVPMNAIYALAASMFCVELARLVQPGQKRVQLIKKLDNLFQKVLEEAKKLA